MWRQAELAVEGWGGWSVGVGSGEMFWVGRESALILLLFFFLGEFAGTAEGLGLELGEMVPPEHLPLVEIRV